MLEESLTLYCARCLTTFTTNGDDCPNLGCGKPRPSEGWGRMHQPGDVFDRNYTVNKTLALGGAGVTYLCRELGEDEKEVGPQIALKVLFATRDHGSYLQRLATEAQILRELDHPNIVQYLGFVHRSGHSPYLLTRFEEGGSLLDHMRRVGTLPVKVAASVGRQVCWALEKAHDKGIIHRDLKPENMLVSEVVDKAGHPAVRVADFGIAKVHGSLGAGLTRIGSFVGTPQYAAPEQFVGQAATPATDVYSLGAVLVFLMTARPVIKNAHRMEPEEVYLLLQDKLPPTIQRPKDPPEDSVRMNAVLCAAMCFDAKQRCSVSEMDRMLEAILEDRDPIIPSPPQENLSEEKGRAAFVELLSVPPATEPNRQGGGPGSPTRSDDEIDVQTRAERHPQVAVDAAPMVSPPAKPKVRRGDDGGIIGWFLGGVGLLFVLVCMAVMGIGVWWYLSQDDPTATEVVQVPSGKDSAEPRRVPRDLRGDPTSSARNLVNLLSRRTKKRGARIWRKCSQGPSGRMHLDLTVEPSGRVRRARPVADDAPYEHWCFTRTLRGRRIPWTGEDPVRFRFKGEL